MSSVEFKVEGFDDLFKKMEEIKQEIGKAKTDRIWRKAMAYAMEPVLEASKDFAPKDTGNLAKHIYMKVHRPMQRDKAGKYYAGEVYMARVSSSPIRDESLKNYYINKRGKLGSYWSNMRPVGLSQEFGNARTAPHPYMRVALEYNYERVTSRLGWTISTILDDLAQGKKG
jgi:HK97 gp10 family phage protein